MPVETQSTPLTAQRWPCGPDCRFAQTLPNTYGEWHWCGHPYVGGSVARDGRECRYYEAASTVPVTLQPPLSRK